MDTPSSPLNTSSQSSNKVLTILGYIIPILFFIPLVTDAKHDPAAKFHANQQLNLLLFWVAVNIVGVIPVLGWFVAMVGWLVGFALMIIGVMNAANGRQKPLPIIGSISLIK